MNEFLLHLANEFELPFRNPILVFSLVLLIILLSPILLKRLNIPGIIGLILAGVVIGPYGLNILEKNSAVNLFSTIGLLYIMFIAGLELDLNEFKANKNKSLLFGFFTFIIPLGLGFVVCYYILSIGDPNFTFDASFLTASMFATHTLVAYPIVSKMGVSKNQAVAITVGGTILTDTAVLIILAVLIGKTRGDINIDFWVRLIISLAIFSGIMFLVIPKIAKWFFRKLENEKHSHYIFVLFIVFLAAFLAELAGVEPIIGAFVAGLALNKLIPHSSALMNRIEFIGNSLFIPFFLISVGMIVNVGVIASGPMAIIIALTLTTVAISGKWLAAFFTQKVFKYSGAQRQVIFGLSSAHAAATLAVILVGHEAGIIDDNILNGTIILILITCIIASFATEKAAKKLVITADDDVIDSIRDDVNRENILVSIGTTNHLEKMIEFASFVKNKKSNDPISLLTVVSNDEEAEANVLKTRKKLEEFKVHASGSETELNVIATIDQSTSSGISRITKEVMADIIILDWPKEAGFLDILMGKKIDKILNKTDKTTFIIQIKKPLAVHKRIVLTAPPLTQHEEGFSLWMTKMAKLSKELSITLLIFCDTDTRLAIEELSEKKKLNAPLLFSDFTDWDDFLIISKDIKEDDLLVLVTARKQTLSYIRELENLPARLDKYFSVNSKIIIYPQQIIRLNDAMVDQYSDFTAEPLNVGIEMVQKLGRGITSIFKRREEEKDDEKNSNDEINEKEE
ncbi:MAG TPA: cation:proton antiporter [Edaphocola sp.]|nr:cation:proton antiporter [Edaphocola sp.]